TAHRIQTPHNRPLGCSHPGGVVGERCSATSSRGCRARYQIRPALRSAPSSNSLAGSESPHLDRSMSSRSSRRAPLSPDGIGDRAMSQRPSASTARGFIVSGSPETTDRSARMTTSEWFAYRWSDAASRLASLPLWFWLALGLGLASVILLNYLARFLAVLAGPPVRIPGAGRFLPSPPGGL